MQTHDITLDNAERILESRRSNAASQRDQCEKNENAEILAYMRRPKG